MTEIEKKFIACLIKQKVTSFKMSLCQHSEHSYECSVVSFGASASMIAPQYGQIGFS